VRGCIGRRVGLLVLFLDDLYFDHGSGRAGLCGLVCSDYAAGQAEDRSRGIGWVAGTEYKYDCE
jgi:hypothetical protein